MCCRRASEVTFVNLILTKCIFDGAKKAQSVIEVSKCSDGDSPGLVTLRRVAFRKNRLIGASGLRMSASSCSDLEMVDTEIADNVCSSDGCGVLLAKKSRLENCTVSGNRVVESNAQPSSLLYARPSSNMTVQGFAASRNDLTVIRVRDGVLSVSNASFNRNALDKESAKKLKISCMHLLKSFAAISTCSFTANEGYRGSVILVQKSNVAVFSSLFWNNSGSERGGCVYASKSNVRLENTTAIGNSAKNEGGCEDSSFPAFLPTSVTMSSALTLWTGGGGTLGRTGPSTSPE